jgi:hypothetical protein
MFIGKSDGKLRDFYRIGKILGTGKYKRTVKKSCLGDKLLNNILQVLLAKYGCAFTESPVHSEQSKFCVRVTWMKTRNACSSMKSIFLKKS